MSSKAMVLMLIMTGFMVVYLVSSQPNYDFYRFSFEFPGAVCLIRDCKLAYLGTLSNFTLNMHGLWPQKYSGSIDFCLVNSYDESFLNRSILEGLNNNWVGAYNPTGTFRNHEWGKHGTCWASQFFINRTKGFFNKGLKENNYNELMNRYFAMVLQLKESLGLEELFFGDKSQEKLILDLNQVKGLMGRKSNIEYVELLCQEHEGEQYLIEARYCLDLEFNFRNCPYAIVTCKEGPVVLQAYIV